MKILICIFFSPNIHNFFYITGLDLLHPDSFPDTQPSLKEIVAELNEYDRQGPIESNWFDIGLQLNVRTEKLQYYIRHHNHDEGPLGAHHDDYSLRDMLAEWLEQKKTLSNMVEPCERSQVFKLSRVCRIPEVQVL